MGSSNGTSIIPFVGKNGWANAIVPGGSSVVSWLQGPQAGSNPTQPLNLQDIVNTGIAAGGQITQNEYNAVNAQYPITQSLQLGTIGALADNIASSPYQNLAGAAAAQGLAQYGNLNNLGNIFGAYGSQALSNSGPNALENNLMGQANSNLSMGSALSNEDQRTATQQAQSQYAANGLGNSAGAAAAGILSRYNMGQQRLIQRQGAASAIDNQVNNATLARSGQALGALGQSANAYGQAATNAYGGANTFGSLNPYTQALGYGTSLAGQNLSVNSGIANNGYNIGMELASNVPSFNANMSTANWNSQNQLNAAAYANQMALLGSALGAGSKMASSAAMA